MHIQNDIQQVKLCLDSSSAYSVSLWYRGPYIVQY